MIPMSKTGRSESQTRPVPVMTLEDCLNDYYRSLRSPHSLQDDAGDCVPEIVEDDLIARYNICTERTDRTRTEPMLPAIRIGGDAA
jgi:hypothetical protein